MTVEASTVDTTSTATDAVASSTATDTTQTAADTTTSNDTDNGASLDAARMEIWKKYEGSVSSGDKATDDGTSDRPRGPDGKFAPKNSDASGATVESDTTTAADGTPEGDTQDQSPEESSEPTPSAIQAPASWSAEMKGEFSKLPPTVQSYVTARETEMSRAMSRLGPAAKFAERFSPTIEQHKDYFDRVKLAPETVFGNYLAFDAALLKDPAAAIRSLADNLKVDLKQLVDESAALESLDPALKQVLSKFDSVSQELDALKASQRKAQDDARAQAEAREAATLNSMQAIVDAFALKNPDYAILENDIAGILPIVMSEKPNAPHADVLREAYDRARRANPVTWQRMQAEQKAASEKAAQEKAKKDAAEAKKRAEAAKAAAAVNVKGASQPNPSANLDQSRMAIWNKYNAA